MYSFIRSIFSCLILLVGLSISQSSLAEKKVMLVLDASGSMWGQIDGTAKIDIARDVVKSMTADWDSNNEIGLITYGHREKGQCGDIETLIPMGKLDATAFNNAVAGLNPIGKTPLTDAVRLAAEKLKYTESAATVILISDGKETCEADPCAVAVDLNKAGIDFTTHVIGFDVSEQEGKSQLQCMAKNTGGEFLAANDAAGLSQALKTAVKKVEEAPVVDLSAPVDIKITAVLSEGGELVDRNDFRVYREDKDDFGAAKRVQVARDYYRKEVMFALPPGNYIAAGYVGDSYTELPITIEPGKKLAVQLNYKAARVKLNTVLSEGGNLVDRNDIRVYREDADDFGKMKRTEVARDYYKTEVVFIIPEGEYVASSYLGSAVAEAPLTVVAGQGQVKQLVYNAGRVKMNAVLIDGGEYVDRNDFRIYREDTDGLGQVMRTQIARDSYKKETVFTVPAGNYIAASHLGQSKAEHEFSVAAGGATEQTIVFNSGRLKLSAASQVGGPNLTRNDFRVYKEQKDEFGVVKRVQVARDYYREEVIFTLAKGDYIVEVINGDLKGTNNVTVIGGKGVASQVLVE